MRGIKLFSREIMCLFEYPEATRLAIYIFILKIIIMNKNNNGRRGTFDTLKVNKSSGNLIERKLYSAL